MAGELDRYDVDLEGEKMFKPGPGPALLVLLALVALVDLSVAERAGAARYTVLQCGWGIGREADWAESASSRFNHSGHCPTSSGVTWDGVHMTTYARPGAGSAAATRFGRWRWTAPHATEITAVRGAWWHRLRSGFQHRLGGVNWQGGFVLKRSASSSQGRSSFAAGFSPGVPAFETRLLCARVSPNRCDTNPSSEASVRGLQITLEDMTSPSASISGSMLEDGWLRGRRRVEFEGDDHGAGVRYSDTFIDGARRWHREQPCAKAMNGGEWRGTEMRPCELAVDGWHDLDTSELSDGKHSVSHCSEDFAGNRRCTGERGFKVDNNPPAAPRLLAVSEGEGWRRSRDFNLTWRNPGQGPGSPIAGARLRLDGPEGFRSGPTEVDGNRIDRLDQLRVGETPGEYRATVWLRDEAGNEDSGATAQVTVRFDDLAPEVGFRGFEGAEFPERVSARVRDGHSGPADGDIAYRAAGSREWTELPTRLEATGAPGEADLVARLPGRELEPGRYELRAVARDGAGNSAGTTRRLDGARMAVVRPEKRETSLTARLEAGGRSGTSLAVGFAARPVVTGRLLRGAGTPLAGRRLELTVTPAAGARLQPAGYRVLTGDQGEFSFPLGAATTRRVEVRFGGDDRLAASRAADLEVQVRGAVVLRAARGRLRTGQVLRLAGRVRPRAAWIPERGKLVAVQFYERQARQWRPVLFTRTGSEGRFRARYRFRKISARSRIRLRAVALPEASWPYLAGGSRAIRVTVRPRLRASRARKAPAQGRRSKPGRPARRSSPGP